MDAVISAHESRICAGEYIVEQLNLVQSVLGNRWLSAEEQRSLGNYELWPFLMTTVWKPRPQQTD